MENKIKVMIIEDDPMVSHLNRKFTERIDGFKVIEEINIDNNMEIKNEYYKRSDLLLLDIYLPGKNGIKLFKEVRNLDFDIDVIVISASKDTDHINDSMHLGAVDYLIKPFSFERFKKSLIYYKKYFIKVKLKNENMTQKKLDLLMGKNRNMKVSKESSFKEKDNYQTYIRELPKGLNKMTLKVIKSCIKDADKALSTQEIADNLGLSRVTIQRYLKYMTNNNIVKINRKYGEVGRPKHFYLIKSDRSEN